MEDIEQSVFDILAKTARVNREDLSRDKSLQDIGIDSLAALELVFSIEDRYDITVPDGAVRRIKTAGDVVDELQRLLAERDKPAS
jgi:acyl carrier protein